MKTIAIIDDDIHIGNILAEVLRNCKYITSSIICFFGIWKKSIVPLRMKVIINNV